MDHQPPEGQVPLPRSMERARTISNDQLIRVSDRVYRLDHAITARQKEILSIFGMSEDDMKAECRGISKELVTINSGKIKSWLKDEEIRNDSTVEDEEERQYQEQATM